MNISEERLAFLKKKYEEKLRPKSDEELDKMGGRPGGRRGVPMKTGKPKNTKASILRLASYLGDAKGRLVIVFLLVIANTAFSLAGSYILRPVINGLTSGAGIPGLIRGVIMMGIIYMGAVICQYSQQRIMVGVSQNAIKKLRNDLFHKLQTLPVRYYDTNNNGDIMSRFTNDVDAIGEMLGNTVIQLFSGSITLVGTLSLMIYTNIWLTLITLVMIPVMFKALMFITGHSRKYYKSQQAAIGTLNGFIEETMSGQKVVKVFGHEDESREEFQYLNQDLKNKQIKALFFGGIMGPVMGNMSQVSYALTACIGGVLCVARGFDIGGLSIFVNYSRQFSRPINEISMQVNTIFSALAGAERVFAVMDEEPEPADPENAVSITEEDGKALYVIPKAAEHAGEYISKGGVVREDNVCYYMEMKGAVTLDDVSFGYVPEKTILDHVSLYAKPGQKIAFVGSTGAGKTTVTNLINRFYDINEGTITIDGIKTTDLSLPSLRKHIAMVLQDTHLFTGTVMENIRYGRLDATDEEVIEAAKTASAHSFIVRLENGYNTVLEGDGANLSQGQRQLINIARAAISKAPILILDEATSSVDTRTEKHIERGMDRLMATRTTFVIAHRLSTVRNANAIIVLEHGKIIERGDHDDLLKNKGRYYELYTGKSELD